MTISDDIAWHANRIQKEEVLFQWNISVKESAKNLAAWAQRVMPLVEAGLSLAKAQKAMEADYDDHAARERYAAAKDEVIYQCLKLNLEVPRG